MTSPRVAIIVGAAGSLALLLYAGRSNTHLLITLGFIVWVLGPFALLALAERRSGSWSPHAQATLRAMTLLIAAASLAIYGYRAAVPPSTTGAFLFVIVPPVTVVLLLIALAIASLMSRPSRKESL
ncbi:MAG TPA: hypothetical protein VN803_08540 [Gemmatimonadales bacterium]|nr:hypothetical protein [Gemmatimonadales bacterium]